MAARKPGLSSLSAWRPRARPRCGNSCWRPGVALPTTFAPPRRACSASSWSRRSRSGSTVCAYVPVGTEPGSIEMLDMLLRRSGRVLLPVARTTADDSAVAAAVGRVPARARLSADRGGCSSRPSPGCRRRPWPRPAWCSCRRWPSTGGACGWAGAAASTTARWTAAEPASAPDRGGARRRVARRVARRAARRADDPRAHAASAG